MFSNLVSGLAVLAACVSATPLSLSSRAVINHDAVVGFPQTVPSGIVGNLYLKYKPYLEVYNGCVPFPAVNANGDTGSVLSLICNGLDLVLTHFQWRSFNFRFAQWRLWQQSRSSVCSRRNLQRRLRDHVRMVHAKG